MGVQSDALFFRSASVATQDSAGRTYAITIPFDTTVNLQVGSSFFQLTGTDGKALAGKSSAAIPVRVPSGQTPPTLHLGVNGRR